MKKAIVSLLVLIAAYWGATNQSKLQSWWISVERPILAFFGHGVMEETPAAPGPEPEPAPAPVVAAPSPPPVHATPSGLPPLDDGVFYTRERITQVTDGGVSVIQARVKVTKVAEQEGKFLVDDGKHRVLTTLSRLTNDPIEVATLLQQDIPPALSPKDARAAKSSAASASRAAVLAESAAKQTKIRTIQAQINEIGRQVNSLTDQVNILRGEAMSAKARGRPSTYNDRTIAALVSQISALEAQRSRLTIEMAALPR